MIGMTFKLATNLKRWSDKRKKEWNKAMSLALSKASYELMTKSKMDLKTGRLKLRRLEYYTDQADPRFGKGKRKKKRRSDRAPLTSLFKGITYKVNRQAMSSEIGFRGVGGTAWTAKLAAKSVEGYSWRYTEGQKEGLHKIGIHLRPTTSAGRVPGRDIMGVVFDKYGKKTFARVNALFLKRIAGERI